MLINVKQFLTICQGLERYTLTDKGKTMTQTNETIRVSWWQDGLHIRPSTPEQYKALAEIYRILQAIDIVDEPATSPSGATDGDYEESVV